MTVRADRLGAMFRQLPSTLRRRDARSVSRSSATTLKPIAAMAVSCVVTLAMLGGAFGEAADPFGGLPGVNTSAPKGADFHDGDQGVDEQRGAATYTYPIAIPPGRSGMQPSVSLAYSSQAPLRGGIAVGWSLSQLPMVEVDRSPDQTKLHYAVNGARLIEVDDVFGTADGSGKAEAIYRVAYDASFTRWERWHETDTGDFWIARKTDGSTSYFEQRVGQWQWRLTKQIDAYGNQITYAWVPSVVHAWDHPAPGKPRYIAYDLASISYTSNASAHLEDFARVDFDWIESPRQDGSLIPVGAQLKWTDSALLAVNGDATGIVTGASQLDAIRTEVKVPGGAWREVQRTKLTYDKSSASSGAQLRYLRYIDVTAKAPCAYGMPSAQCTPTTTSAPRITFSYGRYDRQWNADHHVDLPANAPQPIESGLSGRAAGATTGFLDIDGDGVRDFARILPIRDKQDQKTMCTILWSRGLGGGQFGPESPPDVGIVIPTMDWANTCPADTPAGQCPHGSNSPTLGVDHWTGEWIQERCTMGGQVALEVQDPALGQLHCPNAYQKLIGYHFGDYNNDGHLDLLTTPWRAMALDPPVHGLIGTGPPYSSGDGSCGTSAGCGGESWCSGGHCVPRDVPSPEVPGWNDGDDGGGSGGGSGDGTHQPSPFEPGTCEEWSSLQPVHVQSGSNDYSVWGLLQLDGGAFSYVGSIHSQLPLPPPGQEQLVAASYGPSPLTLQTLIDVNGDGVLDILATPRSADSNYVEEWRAARQDLGLAYTLKVGLGQAGRSYFNVRGVHKKHSAAISSTSGMFPPWGVDRITDADLVSNATLQDMNGDGLPDLVVREAGSKLAYYPNTGVRFADNAIDLGFDVPVSTTHVHADWSNGGPTPNGGRRRTMLQLFDVDEDGRPDLIELQQPGDAVKVRYNLADGFSELHPLPDGWRAVGRPVVMTNGAWAVASDVTDVDGDGLQDIQGWEVLSPTPPEGGPAFADPRQSRRLTWITDDYGTSPPRLLTTVENGRGATTTFEYKPTSQIDGAGIPHPVFVVTKMSNTPDGDGTSPTLATEYRYSKPMYGGHVVIDPNLLNTTGDDEQRAHQFQGFQEVEVLGGAPAGQGHGTDVVNDYEYRVDGRGYLTQRRTYLWANGAIARRLQNVEYHAWQDEPLFDGAITVVREAYNDTRVCSTDVEAECLGDQAADHYTYSGGSRTVRAVLTHGRKALLLPDTASDYASDRPGYRVTHSSFDVLYAENGRAFDYRVLPTETKMEHVEGTLAHPTVTLLSREKTLYDADHFPTGSRKWYGPGENDYVTSERTFDRATGVVLTTKRPEQVRLGTDKVAHISYDANEVFAEVVINEVGYGAHTYYDPGTGAPIHRSGPNTVLVYSDATCVHLGCPQAFQTEETTWTIDGFGRVLSESATYQLGDVPTAAPMVTLSTTSYDDYSGTVTKASAIDPLESPVRWTTSRTLADGLGRALAQTTCRTASTNGSSACVGDAQNAVLSYRYDGAGLLTSITMPNPATDASTVTYTFAHDALGRETKMTRPDGSAMRLEYGPMSKHVIEAGTVANGGSTVAYSDMRGNVTEVLECTMAPCDAMPEQDLANASWSTTRYQYDDAGSLTSVIDAEWNSTVMEHDLLGRRTSITRGARTWSYVYDHDGNVTDEIAPMPANATDRSKYTSHNTYDAIDRITIHVPASREASDDQLKRAWSLPFVYTYDNAPNAVGRLVSVGQETSGPIGAGHVYFLNTTYAYDGMGHVKQQTRWMNPAGLYNTGITQSVTSTYNALGAVTSSTWDDGQKITTSYDDRGQTAVVSWSGGGNLGTNVVADYGVRNRAGLPLSRTTSQTFAKITRSWTYDSSGRVLSDIVQRPPAFAGSTIVEAQRTYAYLPNGELQSVSGKTRMEGIDTGTGFKAINETYAYDTTHRLLSAQETTSAYALALTYDRVGNIVTAKVEGPASTVPTRNVRYNYGWLEPQAVDTITDLGTNATRALMTYTPMGELASRQWPLGSEQRMDWDGDGQLRQVHAPDGTIESYAYDENGQRTWAVKENAADAGTRYWFAGSETSIPAAGTTGRKRYIHIVDASGPLARTERVDNGIATAELTFADSLQNTFLTVKGTTQADGRSIPNSVGVVTSWFHYGAFGEVIGQGGASTHRRQANGKESDAASGLHYYGARYYDPVLMRWVSADPLYRFAPEFAVVEPQRANLYAFTANNPVRLIDPDGHNPYESLVVAQRIQRTATAVVDAPSDVGMAISQWVLDKTIVGQTMKETYDRSQHSTTDAVAYATLTTIVLLLPGPKESPGPGMEGPRMGLEPAPHEMGPPVELPPKPASVPASDKPSGSYTNLHESGMEYHGKGSQERSQESGRRIAEEHNDPHIATDWTPAPNEREAFKQESIRIDKGGGVASPRNYNIRESPGKRFREEDAMPALSATQKEEP